jgi:iron-sulfur cluster assembly accessory protein
MVSLTSEASAQLKRILSEEPEVNPNLGLRVFVAGGGCSGFQYQMVLEDELRDGDLVTESDGIKLYVDQFSLKYLTGAEVDFVNSLMGGGFTVHNPNAVSSCGCGSSFQTADGEGAAAARSCGH